MEIYSKKRFNGNWRYFYEYKSNQPFGFNFKHEIGKWHYEAIMRKRN